MDEFINITLQNIDEQHLCCAIADKKHQIGVQNKKDWLKSRIAEGHVFRKLNCQGKVFVEYAPLEKAWVPINGENYLYIYCLWVAGSFKGKGYGKKLLQYVIDDAKKQNKNGICVISTNKKKPFLSEKSFLVKYGFKVVDKIEDFELLALTFEGENTPSFTAEAKTQQIEDKELNIFYSPQCPYTNNCISEITEYCAENGISIKINKVDSLQKAKNMQCLFNNWATFVNGKYYSNILLNKNSFAKIVSKK